MKKQARIYSPRTANTNAKVCSLKRDSIHFTGHWFLVEENIVTIAEQTSGCEAKAMISISKRNFNRIIRFYETQTRATK